MSLRRALSSVSFPVSTVKGETLPLIRALAAIPFLPPQPPPLPVQLALPRIFHIKIWRPYRGTYSFFPWNI